MRVLVSGGFDPIHKGHVRLFKAAKELGTELIVVVNNDNWLRAKKGYAFMSELERVEIIESIRYVDKVFLTRHNVNDTDTSICHMIAELRPDVFANGGDRVEGNIPEYELCNSLSIQMAFNVGGGKVNSSSELVINVKK